MEDFTAFASLLEWTAKKIESINIDWLPLEFLATIVLLIMLAILATIIYFVGKFILFRIIRTIIRRTPGIYDDIFISKRFLRRVSYVLPMILIYQLISFAIPHNPGWVVAIRKISNIVLIIFVLSAGYSLLDSFYEIYLKKGKAVNKPIKGYLQVIKIVAGFIAGIIIVSILISKAPGALIGGLGAMSAVLMLVFKDTILGFVASIQLSANDMVQLGDWITVDKHKADGDVVEITLSSVKVQNFDNTFTFIPTYSMVADSFQNWRGMQESIGRRIKRSINISVNSVHFVSEEELEKFKKIELVRGYIETKQAEIDEYNSKKDIEFDSKINVRTQTNIGIYRAYLVEYLKNLNTINQEATLMVRQLAPSDNGIPIEIYAFSKDKVWANYEMIVADIFDHVLAATKFFNLEIFQAMSGGDIRNAVAEKK